MDDNQNVLEKPEKFTCLLLKHFGFFHTLKRTGGLKKNTKIIILV